MEQAWADWLAQYLDAKSRNSSEPVLARMSAKQKAEEIYKPVFEAGYAAGRQSA